ncbi:MAG: DUF429 domain-containing protein [Burkholderiales bacterium]|nr:DUF429 domain-containing protein [Burkholderiales bacterium]
MLLHGIDFTSRPRPSKPITVARGRLVGDAAVVLDQLEPFESFTEFDAFLRRPGPWLAACDFPFALPSPLLAFLDWPAAWEPVLKRLIAYRNASDGRERLKTLFKSYCDAHETPNKFAHRAVDILARSSSSMKWVNPPVAWMLLEGTTRLLESGVHLPGLHEGDAQRVAVEAYPALLARAAIGDASYKSDTKAKQTAERHERRKVIVATLVDGSNPLGLRLAFSNAVQERALLDDASGDQLDAALCLMQAAWAAQRADANFGLPKDIAPEGWIVTVLGVTP